MTVPENFDLIRQNSMCVSLTGKLDISGRPLSRFVGQALPAAFATAPGQIYFRVYDPDTTAGNIKGAGIMKLLVINGPNLNLLGIQEPEIYGNKTLADLERKREYYEILNLSFPVKPRGCVVDRIQEAMGRCDGIIINPAAYTHTSIAIPDAIRASGIPAVEVHLSDIGSRESYRRISYTTDACVAVISGRHFEGYKEAVDIFRKKLYNELLANTK